MSGYRSGPPHGTGGTKDWMDDRMSEWIDSRLEAYVDGELPSEERTRLEAFVHTDEDAAEMLRIAQLVRQELARIETPACPPEVTHAVLAQARREWQDVHAPVTGLALLLDHVRSRFDDAWAHFLRPTLAAATLAALVATGALIGRPSPPPPPSVTSAEVEKALQDAKWALAFVSDVSREAGESIRQNVLQERVTAPIQRALGTAFDYEPTS